jgi:hypothetical protein
MTTKINKKNITENTLEYLQLYFFSLNYFFAILGGSLKNTDANSTAKVPISKKVYTSVSMTS